jgi:hypothetical protein
LVLFWSLALAPWSFAVEAAPRPPGVVIAHSPASSGIYLGSPGVVKLDDRTLLAKCDEFGPGSTEHSNAVTRLYRSRDGGKNWRRLKDVRGQYWSSIFAHRGAVYLIGPDRHNGQVVIRRSVDRGRTWTEPRDERTGQLTADSGYHCAPVPVVEHAGRLWRAMEDTKGPGGWGSQFRAFMMSAPADADLLLATSWTFSNRVGRDPSWLDGRFGGWLEGNAVVTPEGRIANMLRADFRAHPEKAALIDISADGRTASFDPATGFVEFPGGCKKFTIRRDPRDGSYWTLSNFVPESQRGGEVERTRNTLALVHSRDLRHWEVRSLLLHHPERDHHGFQYVDWVFEAADLIAVVRTAFDDETGGAHNSHDSNFITFHCWRSFRALTMKDSVAVAAAAMPAPRSR